MENKKGLIGIIALVVILGALLGYGIIKDKKDASKNANDYEAWVNNSSSNSKSASNSSTSSSSSSNNSSSSSTDKDKEAQKDKKNFFKKLSDKENVNVVIIGDRIALSEGKTSEEGIWSEGVSYIINKNYGSNATIKLLAQADLTAEKSLDFISKEDFSNYDLAIICLGHNDSDSSVDIEKFKSSYDALIKKITEKNPVMTTWALLPSTLSNDNTYRQAIINVCKDEKVNTVDTRKQFETNGVLKSELMNGNFPNNIGYQYYTATIGEVLQALTQI